METTARPRSAFIPDKLAAGYASVDHRHPETVIAMVTDDFQLTTFTLGGQPVDKAGFIDAMERRRQGPAQTRHLVSNLRALDESDDEVHLAYVLVVHRLEPDADATRLHVIDVEDTWRHVDDDWRLASRSLTLAFPRLYEGTF
ncbi:MAG: nuclear transport factor 2 family protein [Dermatophilaceae bacterium]